ncbi:MAG: hypothetical protein EOM51_10780 [Clostridia bacterium]|nr:hypothetical protein [Clostridia bacterium]
MPKIKLTDKANKIYSVPVFTGKYSVDLKGYCRVNGCLILTDEEFAIAKQLGLTKLIDNGIVTVELSGELSEELSGEFSGEASAKRPKAGKPASKQQKPAAEQQKPASEQHKPASPKVTVLKHLLPEAIRERAAAEKPAVAETPAVQPTAETPANAETPAVQLTAETPAVAETPAKKKRAPRKKKSE